MGSYFTEDEVFGSATARKAKPKPKKPAAKTPVSKPSTQAEAVAPSGTEAVARGALQGATIGFADELAGATAIMPDVDPLGSPIPSADEPAPSLSGAMEEYRRVRDESRAANEAAEEAHPKKFLAGQIAGGVATAPILPGGAVKGVLKAGGAGLGYGAVSGLGGSDADLTKGEFAKAAVDTGVGAGVGLGAGILGQGLIKGAGKLWRKIRGTDQAEKVAEKTVEQIGGARGPLAKETSTRLERAAALEEKWSGMLGGEKKSFFSAAEASGDPALALAESKARQMGGAVGAATQAERRSRLRNTAQVFDMYAREIAGNTDRLGKAEIGEQFGTVVQKHLDELRELRSGVAAKMFGEAERLTGDKKVVPMRQTAQALNKLVQELRNPLATSPDKALVSELRSLSDQIVKAADDGAPVDAVFRIQELQNALASWGKKAASGGQGIANDADSGTKRYVASQIFGALQRDLDNAANSGASRLGQAGEALVKARNAYREMSEEIANVSTEAIEKITKKVGTDSADTMTDRILGMSKQQIEGVFRVAQKADPDMANQMRAEMFQTLLERKGKPRPGAQELADLGVTELQPKGALGLLDRHWEKLQAAYAGNTKAKLALGEIAEGLRNLATGPGLEGSQTAPLAAEMARDAASAVASRAADTIAPGGSAAIQKLGGLVAKLTNSEQAAAKAVASPEGIQMYREALRLQLAAQHGKTPSDRSVGALMAAFSRLGLEETDDVLTAIRAKSPETAGPIAGARRER